ncbi:hypothetical protein RV12_GL000684 [Enterococcus quebecensis]|nr:hypothetical protein RV12_GL000684 [Enterococcus quebecensis]
MYLIVIGCSIGICFLGLRLNVSQQHQRKIEYAEETVRNEAVKIKQLNNQVRTLYQNDQEEFLIHPLEESSIVEVEEQIESLKSKAEDFGLKSKDFSMDTSDVVKSKQELVNKINQIKNKSSIQNQIAALLVDAPSDWATTADTVVINEKVTLQKIERMRSEITGNTGVWHNAITIILNEMDNQVKQYNELKQSIERMIDGESLTNDATIENFILSFNQLELIKNTILRKELTDKLELIDKRLESHSAGIVPNGLQEEIVPSSQ